MTDPILIDEEDSIAVPATLKRAVSSGGLADRDSEDPVNAKSVPVPICGAGVMDSVADPSIAIRTSAAYALANVSVDSPLRVRDPSVLAVLFLKN